MILVKSPFHNNIDDVIKTFEQMRIRVDLRVKMDDDVIRNSTNFNILYSEAALQRSSYKKVF